MNGSSKERALYATLVELVSTTDWLMQALNAVCSSIDVPWCIGAGAIRTCVWDHLHGYPVRVPDDVDVAFFDAATGVSEERRIAEGLTEALPGWQWDVVNQAHAHKLSKRADASAFLCLEDAIACWPETATAVGVYMRSSGTLHVLAPHGLSDLFGLVLRVSPRLRDGDVFERRRCDKRWHERWPRVRYDALTAL